jgi:MtrB/PioB family decaheme-associated outer membrane protein
MRARNALPGLLALLAVRPASLAAEEGEPGAYHGSFQAGGQRASGDTSSSKLEEYRAVPDGLLLPGFRLEYASASRSPSWTLEGADLGRQDQRIRFRSGAPGLWSLELQWDRIPHRLSNDSLSIYDRVAGNEFRLPAEVQESLSGMIGRHDEVTAAFDALARDFDLSQRLDDYDVTFRWRPDPAWEVRFGYHREDQGGTKPFSSNISPFQPNEVPEPVDWTTHRFETSAEWAARHGFASFRLALSRFENAEGRVVWDQPFVREDPGRAYQGAAALPPDNRARELALAGGLSWGKSQRLVATLSHSLWTQNQPFLPYTINPDIVTPPLPRPGLDGRIASTLVDLRYSARPHRRVGLQAFLRGHRLDNDTGQLVLDGIVTTDAFELGEAVETLPVGYRKANAGVDLDFELARRMSLGIGYEVEDRDRDFREVESARERIARISFRATPNGRLGVRVRGEMGRRRYDAYRALDPESSPDERKFDQANRDREEAELMVQWAPVTPVSVSASYSYRSNDYPDTVLGLARDRSKGLGLDVAWSPHDRVQLYANWSRETYRWDGRQRYLTGGPEDPLDDWSSRNRDEYVVWGAGVTAALWKERLDCDVRWSRSDSEGRLENDWVPGGDPSADDIADFPLVGKDLRRLDAALRLRLARGWDVRAGYVCEKYEEADFKLDPMAAYMGSLDPGASRSSFLAVRVPGYDADIASVLVGYRW